jgi:uncharacterized membrane protein YphA (DoxX/SURF4 family)
MIKRVIIEVISLLFILLFVYASVSKLLEYEKFAIQIGQSPLLTGFGGVIPSAVIAVELIVAAMLAVPRLRLAAFFGAFSLMVMFTAYIYAVLNYSPYVPCSCGGVLEKMGWKEHLLFNAAFVVLALTGIFLTGRMNSQPQQV